MRAIIITKLKERKFCDGESRILHKRAHKAVCGVLGTCPSDLSDCIYRKVYIVRKTAHLLEEILAILNEDEYIKIGRNHAG